MQASKQSIRGERNKHPPFFKVRGQHFSLHNLRPGHVITQTGFHLQSNYGNQVSSLCLPAKSSSWRTSVNRDSCQSWIPMGPRTNWGTYSSSLRGACSSCPVDDICPNWFESRAWPIYIYCTATTVHHCYSASSSVTYSSAEEKCGRKCCVAKTIVIITSAIIIFW